MNRLLLFLLVLSLASCTTGYQNEGNVVTYHRWNEGSGHNFDTIDASSKTFQVLAFDEYAKDHKNVFYNGKIIPGADAATFEAIDDYYARDKNTGYHGSDTVENSRGTTFRLLEKGYTTDGLDIFYDTSPLHVVDIRKFHFVQCEGIWGCWTSDGKYYYFNESKVPSADYAHLEIIKNSGGFSKDTKWVYFSGHKLNDNEKGIQIIDTIDAASFEVKDFFDCRDKWGCINQYHGREKCEN